MESMSVDLYKRRWTAFYEHAEIPSAPIFYHRPR